MNNNTTCHGPCGRILLNFKGCAPRTLKEWKERQLCPMCSPGTGNFKSNIRTVNVEEMDNEDVVATEWKRDLSNYRLNRRVLKDKMPNFYGNMLRLEHESQRYKRHVKMTNHYTATLFRGDDGSCDNEDGMDMEEDDEADDDLVPDPNVENFMEKGDDEVVLVEAEADASQDDASIDCYQEEEDGEKEEEEEIGDLAHTCYLCENRSTSDPCKTCKIFLLRLATSMK